MSNYRKIIVVPEEVENLISELKDGFTCKQITRIIRKVYGIRIHRNSISFILRRNGNKKKFPMHLRKAEREKQRNLESVGIALSFSDWNRGMENYE